LYRHGCVERDLSRRNSCGNNNVSSWCFGGGCRCVMSTVMTITSRSFLNLL
jgi:hypothetical protein